jgi:hypothetical protein
MSRPTIPSTISPDYAYTEAIMACHIGKNVLYLPKYVLGKENIRMHVWIQG